MTEAAARLPALTAWELKEEVALGRGPILGFRLLTKQMKDTKRSMRSTLSNTRPPPWHGTSPQPLHGRSRIRVGCLRRCSCTWTQRVCSAVLLHDFINPQDTLVLYFPINIKYYSCIFFKSCPRAKTAWSVALTGTCCHV